MFPQTPPLVETLGDGREETRDMWPPWSGSGAFATSNPEWELQPDDFANFHRVTLLPRTETTIHANGVSPSNMVEAPDVPRLYTQGQNITPGIVSGDWLSPQPEDLFLLPQPQPTLANTNGDISHTSMLLATSLSGQQLPNGLLPYMPDAAFATTPLSPDRDNAVQHPLLPTGQAQLTSHTLMLSTFTPGIFDPEVPNLGLSTTSSITLSEASLSPRTLSTATSPPAAGSPSAAAQPEKSTQTQVTLSIIQYGQPSTRKSTKGSGSQPSQPRQPAQTAKKRHAVSKRVDVMSSDTAPLTITKKDQSGRVVGEQSTFGADQIVRTRPANLNRAIVACRRCRKDKTGCIDPGDEFSLCVRCALFFRKNFFNRKHLRGDTFMHQPCFKVEVVGLSLHRLGPTKYKTLETWVSRKQQLLQYSAYNTTQYLFLTQGFGEGTNNALCLKVARFDPLGPEDRTAYFWTDKQGRLRKHEMPPYFISDLDYAKESVITFLRDARDVYIDKLLGKGDPLIRRTFDVARSFAADGKSPLISTALDVWVSARFIEDHWQVFCGGLQIGAVMTNEPGHPYHGFIPVTPIMDTQLDDLVIRVLIKPRLDLFLARLKKKLDERKRENWLELFLAKFVMMSNIGWVIKDMIAMTTWKGLKPGNRGGTLTQGYIHACKTILAHFHGCAGSVPLATDFEKIPDKAYLRMTPDQIDYLKFLRREITRLETKLNRWKDLSMYDDDAYWVYQLLCKDWKGDSKHPGEIDDFSEDDFLSSSST